MPIPRSSAARCCCGTSTGRCSIRSSPSPASRTWTPTAPAARSRTRAVSTTPRSNGLSCLPLTTRARCRRSLPTLAGTLQRDASDAAARLRSLLLAGVLAALVLAAAAAYFQVTRARHERAAREAQEQTRDILKTVREGFFLLDADYRIGSVWSEALTRMFSRNDFAGLSFEELLKDLVPAADAVDGHQVHQAAVGRPRPRKPDEEHQPAGPARDHDGQRPRRQGDALPAVRLPPRHGPGGRQARAVLGGRHHLERAAGARAAGLAGERQRSSWT